MDGPAGHKPAGDVCGANTDFGRIKNALRARSAAVDPGLDQFAQPLLGAGCGVATGPWLPGPADEIVVRQISDERTGSNIVPTPEGQRLTSQRTSSSTVFGSLCSQR